ncbi:TVP38/TMEM64 family protein [Bacillus thermotolerans]|uniref:TVP38/TMEM64 family membrane protein n=1 Tax=Bacillus thermotolerans TaxID=1221996 RepID=A0A0F5HN07_BACTR|nr:VTT domain-containing protein [Bacillus thermotolerans]KKB34430.1 membrane protein [Bacillus thermotolerans]KKB38174.1 putative membrane protein [Bacillus thermotolerans]
MTWMPANPVLAFVISIILNILIAVSGVLPSAFITAANVAFFGFEIGLLVSIAGEAAGAVVSFVLYRKGLQKLRVKLKHRLLMKLQQTKGAEAIGLVLLLRVLPFVPSGFVTLAAAYSQMGLLSFSLASTLGKVPSLTIEAYSVQQVLKLTVEWQIILVLFIMVVYVVYRTWKRSE